MMEKYCQKDKRWADLTIGKTNLTMAKFGCLVTAISILDSRTPDVALKILNDGNAFTDNGLLIWDKAADLLGFNYYGVMGSESRIPYPCIAETHKFAPKYPQHFFVYEGFDNHGPDRIIDPLDGKEKANLYPIATFRLFTKDAKYAG
jgi:hypothetical protein